MIEKVILANLLYNNAFCREVFPYIKENYFQDIAEQKLFNSFSEYVENYKEPPSKEALSISVSNRTDMNESAYKQVTDLIDSLKIDENTNIDWLKSETEKFCQDRDLFNAIRRSITILDGNDKELDKGSIPKLLSDSLSINFDTVIGHDYFEEYADRYAYYHHKESRIPFDLKILNLITKGGLPKKSLTLFLGETGSGKSLVKCHIASAALLAGLNVLYISMELSSEEIGRRIDANILNVNLDQVGTMDEDVYEKRVNRYKDKTPGKLIIKDYPTGAASAAHFRHLINELKLKKNFKPDIICIDYLNICSSSRVKGAGANQYAVIKSIAEEIRGLAMETDTAIISSSQLNRSGYGNGDPDLTNTSESMGIVHTADAVFALIVSEEYDELGQIGIKQLKNRWGDLSYYRRFVLGIERAKMKLFDVEDSAQIEKSPEPEKPRNSEPTKKSGELTVEFGKGKKNFFNMDYNG